MPDTGATSAAEPPHPFLTPQEDFYDVSRGKPKPHTLEGQALADAGMTRETWRLEVASDGFAEPPGIEAAARVGKPLTLAEGTALDFHALEELGKTRGVKYIKALQCLNIAEPLGQGLWEGVPLREVLGLCGELENVRRIYYRGFHNDDPDQVFQSSVSYTQAMETPPGELPAILAYRLNGEPISPERGGPVRMVVPWAHGFKSIKWLQQVFLTNDYRTNDTYALRNNDPDSWVKTAAYLDFAGKTFERGTPVTFTGQVISGLSGFRRLEVCLRPGLPEKEPDLAVDDPRLLEADWQECALYRPPRWDRVLPGGTDSRELLGFDPVTGEPLAWPTRYGVASWSVSYRDLEPGRYAFHARAVDGNGHAQPEPRPMRKAGKNPLQTHRFEIA